MRTTITVILIAVALAAVSACSFYVVIGDNKVHDNAPVNIDPWD